MATLAQEAQWFNDASSKYNVPVAVLFGVWGMETDFGRNVKTSSAGAMGEFQFMPDTARQYGYPMTNSPTDAQAHQQLDSAAHYLSDLLHQWGNWDTALRKYSGGGYGLAEVQNKAKNPPKGSGGGINIPIPPVGPDVPVPHIPTPGDIAGAVGDIGSTLGRIADLLTSGAFWLRVAETIGGVVLLILGLFQLAGQSPADLAGHAATAASMVAK